MSYDEYIRSILGYPNNDLSNEGNNYEYNDFYRSNNELDPELEDCYPEIYKVVYPMVQKACNENQGPYNRDTVEKLTDEIYYAIEGDNNINININLNNDVKTSPSTNNMNRSTTAKVDVKQRENMQANTKTENRESRRQNGNLRDIIKILLLRELLNRPNRPRPPMRPPFPGGPRPPMPGTRPPMYPRTFENDLYEY